MILKRYETGQAQLRGSTVIMDQEFRVAVEVDAPENEHEKSVDEEISEHAAVAFVRSVEVAGASSKGPSALRLLSAILSFRLEFGAPIRRIVVKGTSDGAEWWSL